MAEESPEKQWPAICLNNGNQMPALCLATHHLRNQDMLKYFVDEALTCGIRSFDTAPMYGNETMVNKAFSELLPKFDLTRDDIFVIGKQNSLEIRKENTLKNAYEKTLNNLGLEYLDLYLIQPLAPGKMNPINSRKHSEFTKSSWSTLIDLYNDGMINSIGVSNFNSKQLQDLLDGKFEVTPAVNQIDFNPDNYDDQLRQYCHQNDVAVQAYHTLDYNVVQEYLIKDPKIIKIARDLDKSPAQVLKVWALQKDIGLIIKTSDKNEISKYCRLNFKLTERQTKIIDQIAESHFIFGLDFDMLTLS